MDTFADRVRTARKKAELNQKQLAKKAGLSQTTISDIERGRNEGSRDVVALANALKVSAEWLINGEAPKHGNAELQAVAEFSKVYMNSTEEGRAFLRDTVAAVKVAFARGEQKKQA